MKKILFVVESLSGGGAEKVLTTIIKNLNKEKYDVTVYSIVKTGVYVKDIENYCDLKYALKDYNNYSMFGKLFYKFKSKLIYNLNINFVYRWLIKEKYDIEIAFVEGFDTKLVAASPNKKSKKYAWVHIDMIARDYADSYYDNLEQHIKCYECFDRIICVSKQVKDQFEKKFKLHNTIVIYNPIEKDYIRLHCKKYCVKNKIKICVIGRLEYQKGIDRLIYAFHRIKKYYSNYNLKIIGDGTQKDLLIKLVNDLELSDKIKFTGFLENPYDILSDSNLLICSSRSEGFSLVIAEALCLGIPVMSTICVGPTELIGNGKYGILVENSIDGLIDGLITIFENNNLLYELHKKSIKRSNIFDLKKIMFEVENIFDE